MLVVVTYDENGGFWDHIAPPKADRWGPGSRIPALTISPFARKGFADHTPYDTTSILRFVTARWKLPVLPGLIERDKALATHNEPPMGDLTAALDPSAVDRGALPARCRGRGLLLRAIPVLVVPGIHVRRERVTVDGRDKPGHDGGDGRAGHWIAIPAHTLHQGDSSHISRAIPHADCGRVSLTYGWTKPLGLKQRLKSGAPYGRSGAATEFLGPAFVRGGSTGRETTMALPDYSMRQLLEAGVHFGHQAHRWNPKMAPFIFGTRNNIHIIDLAQTVPSLHRALQAVSDTVARGGRVLFVGTKRQAADAVADAAKRSAQYYVNSRWLGGMLTNWKTISHSIARLKKLEEVLSAGEGVGYTKKERLTLQREREKLDRALGGIRDMGGLPDLLFVIDTNKEDLAVAEARRLGIPVAAILDTNCDPDGIAFPVPGNDDAGRAINLYCDLVARAAIDGIGRAQGDIGVDLGAAEAPLMEDLPSSSGEPLWHSFEPLSGPRGIADDLKKLTGVSPAIEKKLTDLGIFHFSQIASLDPQDAHRIGEEVGLPGRVDGWIAQAKELTAEVE
jgi:small subunit ribosomal protein S2